MQGDAQVVKVSKRSWSLSSYNNYTIEYLSRELIILVLDILRVKVIRAILLYYDI